MKEIEIPFGAKDSELKGWEYTIPEGMEAEIKDGKIVVREKESEDERIRKEIISALKFANDGGVYDKHIAYLEKQKESTWTEEDEIFRKHILPRILDPKGWTMEQIDADRERLKEFVERQKNKWVEKRKEQKPADRFEEAREKYQVEWSDEDERMLKSTIWHISNSLTNGKNTDCKCDLTEWLKERLKSLRPSWKPSEEQMEALEECGECKRCIKELYEQLKGIYNNGKD